MKGNQELASVCWIPKRRKNNKNISKNFFLTNEYIEHDDDCEEQVDDHQRVKRVVVAGKFGCDRVIFSCLF